MSANDEAPLTGAQCRAARALTDISRTMLADASKVAEEIIAGFERRLLEPEADLRAALRHALENFGALFLTDDGQGGAGVRLKFSAAEAERIENLENEGGQVAEDDVVP